jgi:rubrerythrin
MNIWNGPVYLCEKCGNIFNNKDLKCPACTPKTKAKTEPKEGKKK